MDIQFKKNKRVTGSIITGLLITFSITAFGQEENWDTYMANYEKGPGSTLVDLSYKTTAPLKDYPYLLVTGVKTTQCEKDGLPLKKEFDSLYKISDAVNKMVELNGKSKLVGTFTYQCKRLDYYYLQDTAHIREKLDSFYKTTFPSYEAFTTIKSDKAWEVYLGSLYPGESTLEYMSNQKVIMQLMKAGDKLTKPRKIDHYLYFKTKDGRASFSNFAKADLFSIEETSSVQNTAYPYLLKISRVDRVELNAITNLTLKLKTKAKEFDGEYDGWECIVIKD